MIKIALLASLLSLSAIGTSAACTPSILAPYDIITYDLGAPSTPGWSTKPFFEAARSYDGTGYKQLLRFNPPSEGASCSWVMNLPSSRFSEVLQGKPSAGPVQFAFYGVEQGGYTPGTTLAELKVKPGPFGVNSVMEGKQVIHAEPCKQIGGEVLVQIPDWVSEQMWAYWIQDIRPSDEANSLGIYMQVGC